jgi:hypothetical protein
MAVEVGAAQAPSGIWARFSYRGAPGEDRSAMRVKKRAVHDADTGRSASS